MRKFKGYVRTDKVGSTHPFEFEVDDEITEEDLEEAALDKMLSCIEWNYEEDFSK